MKTKKLLKLLFYFPKNEIYGLFPFTAVDDKGKGRIYSSYMDCVNKIYKLEGFVGFFKGTGPNYLRIGPHTVLCLVFWDELKRIHDNFLKDGKTMKK